MRLIRRQEKRSMKRHRISLPLLVRVCDKHDKTSDLLGVSIRDISGTGAFINSVHPCSLGQSVEIDITLPLSKLKTLNTVEPKAHLHGKINRVEKNGFAVNFTGGSTVLFESVGA